MKNRRNIRLILAMAALVLAVAYSRWHHEVPPAP